MDENNLHIEVRTGDVVCHRYEREFMFSPVLAVGEIGGIHVMPNGAKETIVIKRDEVVSIYREVFF